MVDPTQDKALVAAYKSAKPPQPPRLRPLFRLILFHILTLGTIPIALPISILRAAIPFLRPNPRMKFVQSLAILMVRYSIGLMVLTHFQPIAARENGLRERSGVLGAMLAALNMSGPGSRVAHPLLAAKAASKVAHKQDSRHRRNDRVWFDAPSMPYYRGIISLKPPGKAPGPQVQDCTTYNGPAMVDVSWAKSRTRGFWFLPNASKQHPPSRTPGGQTEPVVLYFHGGAGVTFSAGDLFMGETLAQNLARSSKLAVFSVDYSLAPYAPFPIPLVQALGGYLYLTDTLGYRPEQIFIGGDSFGAHLTLQLERYLRLEMPAIRGDVEKQGPVSPGLLLLSPWLSTVNEPFQSRPQNLSTDIITLTYGDWGVESMRLGPKYKDRCSLDLLDPWLSPVYKSVEEIAQLPPMFVANGGVEVLLDEGKEFVRKARQAKNDVTHVISPLQPHDFFTLHTALPASRKVYTQFGQWARKHLESAPYTVA